MTLLTLSFLRKLREFRFVNFFVIIGELLWIATLIQLARVFRHPMNIEFGVLRHKK